MKFFRIIFFVSLLLLSLSANLKSKNESIDELLAHAKHHIQNSQSEEACACYRQVIQLDENNFEALFYLASELFHQYNHDESIFYYTKAIALYPSCAQAYFNRGLVFLDTGKHTEAINDFESALHYNPRYTKARTYLGRALEAQQNYSRATEHYKKFLIEQPQSFEIHLALARTLLEQEHLHEAKEHLTCALQVNPTNLEALLGLGNIFSMQHQFEDALHTYTKMLELAPEDYAIRYNLAYILKKLGRLEEAINEYQRVIEQNPKYIEAHFGLGTTYLLNGNFSDGWPEYEWRWKRAHTTPRTLSQPQWDGSDLNGKIILLHAEQGLGDTLQFIRYARTLKKQGATIIAAVQDPLIPLLSQCPYLDTVISLWAPFPHYDVHAPLLTLPLIMNTTEETIPSAHQPYLYAQSDLIDYWHTKLAHDKNFKIGLCWQGNASYQHRFLKAVVAAKSIPINVLEPLSTIPGISFYSLQKINGTEQLNTLPSHFQIISFDDNFDQEHGRFMDTTALIKNLNLIITVDTSIAHLAGALGAHVWLLLPNPPDWRWMLNRSDTPWYPTMQLFRQPEPGNWHAVIQEIYAKLCIFLNYNPEQGA